MRFEQQQAKAPILRINREKELFIIDSIKSCKILRLGPHPHFRIALTLLIAYLTKNLIKA